MLPSMTNRTFGELRTCVKLLFSPVPSDATHFDDHGGSASSFFKRSEVSSTELMNSFAGIDLETFR
jgi:hypothetical protein